MASPIFLCLKYICFTLAIIGASAQGGTWQILNDNIGIACMHAAVTRWNTVVCLDRTDVGASNLTFPPGHPCRNDPNDMAIKTNDCSAHSCVFDLITNVCRPLMIQTDTWCSSGQFLPNGSLLQSGGWNDGSNTFRMFDPCISTGSCDWYEFPNTTLIKLYQPRWYSTNQILPDGTIIIVGGNGQNSLEYYPPQTQKKPVGAVSFPFLAQMNDNQKDNLYPFVHLLPNGYLFIFANTKYLLYNYTDNTNITQNLPPLPGGPRNYPSAGSSVMLALQGDFSVATIVICGGAQPGAFKNKNTTLPGQTSCWRINATNIGSPSWQMENMPEPRIMGEMVMLPTGDVCIINGARAGSQGFTSATNASLNPFLYRSDQPVGSRFTILNPTNIPRMYHSTANLLPNGCIMVAGSNTHKAYTWTQPFPTELRVEAFCPDYLSANNLNSNSIPVIVKQPKTMAYGVAYNVYFNVSSLSNTVELNMASAPFSTHSFSQGQRLIKLTITRAITSGGNDGQYRIVFQSPPNAIVAPPGYYMIFVVNGGVPSNAKWVPIGIS